MPEWATNQQQQLMRFTVSC